MTMRSMWTGRSSAEMGQSLPLIVVMFVVLCGFVGMTVDVGYGMLQKRRLQASVDLGLLSGAQELPIAANASTVATSYVHDNFAKATDQPVTVTTSTSCMTSGCAKDDRLALTATTQTPTFFAKLFGIDTWTVRALGAACGPCDSSPVSYDVIVVLDRSNSMCTDANNNYNGCQDLINAKAGIKDLLDFFDPKTDRVSLAVLSSSDTAACSSTVVAANCPLYTAANGWAYSHTLSRANGYTWTPKTATPSPCDGAYPSLGNGQGTFYRSLGDFMDGTPSNHDAWVVVPLSRGTNFKNADGTINDASPFVSTLDCIEGKGWTPMAPAISESAEEMRLNGRVMDANGRPVYQAIVYFGDGGATSTPVRRDSNGVPSTNASWYTWTTGNRDRPCHDAVAQAQRAWNSYGINVYTIGYALDEGSGQVCKSNSGAVESGLTARTTLQQMAQGEGRFYEKAGSGDVSAIFQEIGHAITAGGTRLVD